MRFRLPVAKHLAEAGYDVQFIGPAGPESNQLEASGFSYVPFDGASRGPSPFSDVLSGYRLAQIYRDENPDIVHHFGLDAAVHGGIAAHRAGMPWVVHSVPRIGLGTPRPYWLRAGARTILRRAMRDAEVTVQSDEDRQLLISKGCVRPDFIHVIGGDVVDPEQIAFVDEPAGEPVAALVGHFERPSDLDAFAEAAQHIPTTESRASVHPRFAVVVPYTDLNNDTRRRLEQWQEEGVVEWWPRSDVEASVRNVHLVVARSCRAYDVRGVLLTAAATGRPIVAFDSHGCRGLVRHGSTGLLLPPDDSPALEAALSDLLFDADRRRTMGRQARRFIEEEYAARHIARQHMAVYQRLYERGREI